MIHIISNVIHIVKVDSEIFSHCLNFVEIVKSVHYNIVEVSAVFAERLRLLRKERNLTQEQLALEIGVERSSIGKYEGKSRVIPSEDVKCKIAEFFGVSIDYLLGYSDNRTPAQYGFSLSDHEIEIVKAYRSQPVSVQCAICDILHIDHPAIAKAN